MSEGNKFKIDSSGSIVRENSSTDSSGNRIPREFDLFGFVVDFKTFMLILATILFFFRFSGCKYVNDFWIQRFITFIRTLMLCLRYTLNYGVGASSFLFPTAFGIV